MEKPFWTPTADQIRSSNMTEFMNFVNTKFGHRFVSYDELYHWSVDNVEQFWETVWDHSEIIHSQKYESVLSGDGMFKSKWFEGAKLNYSENLLKYRDDKRAIIHWREKREPITYTYAELYQSVASCTAGLRKLGLSSNDRIAVLLPNVPEAVITMLAAGAIGALYSSCSPDFGFKSVMDRFGQIQPKILVTTDSYFYNDKKYDLNDKIIQLVEQIPSIEQVVIVTSSDKIELTVITKIMIWEELLSEKKDQIEFEQLPFDHPLYIMYSSGTTGAPKCIVHSAGGTFIQHYKEHKLHTNISRDDVVFYYTTTGWMMWNWLVGSLSQGATIFLYDGSPSFPNLNVLWEAAEKVGVTVFGTSPKFLSTCQVRRLIPKTEYSLSKLKTILSTGAPLADENYRWVYDKVKAEVQLSSISGGTDIISCFMLGNPNLPVYSEQIQCRGLGMAVETFDQSGESILNEVGELVCTKPFPSMPVCFWNDKNDELYFKAYFNRYKDIWHHGDYIKITTEGTVVVYGRSDATLNPGGVRIGTAEIYGPVEAMDEIVESIVIGVKVGSDTEIVLFVVLSEGLKLDDELIDKIKNSIRDKTSPRHVPSKIFEVNDIPRTLNGKKVEIAVTNLIHNRPITNFDALANPESLKQFEAFKYLHNIIEK